MSSSPVFIVGSPRSGTSILIASLLRSGYNGFLEGNFLSLARVLERDVDRFFASFYTENPKVLTSKIDRGALKQQLGKVVLDAAIEQQPPPPWVDKTGGPEMIETIPLLRRTFPTARFVFAKRRALENVVSRLIKFPGLSFEYHCTDWARTMTAWRTLRDTAPGQDLLEIDQREISAQPDLATKRLTDFLDLTNAEAMMMLKTFTSSKPQETRAGTSERVLCLDTLDWTDDQKQAFHRHCDSEMEIEGYSLDTSYWRTPAA